MIKKSFFVLTAAVAMLFASCEKYDQAISDIEDRLDKIESVSLTTIDQQIVAINASINDLKAFDTELGGYISALQTTAADLQSQIDATNTALAALESNLEGQITASEQKVLNELNTVKNALESQLATINNTIATLQAKDAELDQKIVDLQKYVDSEIKSEKDWASATFSTLEQYEATQTAISEIRALITSTQESITALEEKLSKKIADDIATAVAGVNADVAAKVKEITDAYTAAIATAKTEIEAAYTKAIADAIAASKASMKAWVNGKLQKVYAEIADVQADLAALAASVATDKELAAAVAAQQAELKKAKNDLIAAYTKAIEEAIEDNNGVINGAIATAITTATNNLQSEINSIKSEIANIKNRLATLESKVENLIARIQSIRFLPEYSDGKVELTSDNAPVTLTFLLSPNETAQAVAKAYERNKSVVTAYLSLTQERTRAVGTPTQINVTKVTTGTADGVLTVEVNTKNLRADYWATAENANLFIRINDGNNNVISEMIPTFYTLICELPSGYEFRTAVHAQLADDTKAIKFIANSKVVTEHQVGTSHAYMQLNGTTLEIHTAAKEFIFNKLCNSMFSTLNNGHPKFANITTIDFNGCINTSKVTDMGYMFYGCQALNSLDLSSFNTANVTNMVEMFNRCYALNSLDLSSFNTANVEHMDGMFYMCYALNSLDLSSFNTANVEYMNSMFNQCYALNSLDLSSFNTANVTNMSTMFFGCQALKSLNLSSFNTANVTNMSRMFSHCQALESLDLSSFNTANVTNMQEMFYDCQALNSLDIRNFDMGKVTNSSSMFFNVGLLYKNTTGNMTPIKVTNALKSVLESKNVSTGDKAEYFIVDNLPG